MKPNDDGSCCSHNIVIRDTVPALRGAVRDVWFCCDCKKSFSPMAPLTARWGNLQDDALRDAVVEAVRASKDELDYVLKLASKMGVDYPELADLSVTVEALERAEEK
jgi:hypothetical protein